MRKTQFPRLVIPLAVVLTSLFNLGLNLVVVLVFLLAFGVAPMWTWLLFPSILVLLIAITVAVSMLVSSLFPRFRDLAIIWTVLSTVLFYASPGALPAREGAGDAARHHPDQPAGAAARARAQVGHRPDGARARRRSPGATRAAARRSSSSCWSAWRRCGCSTARRRGSRRSCDARRGSPSRWSPWSCWPGSALMERDWRLQERGAARRSGPAARRRSCARAERDLQGVAAAQPDPAPDLNLALLAQRPEPAASRRWAMLDGRRPRASPTTSRRGRSWRSLATDDPRPRAARASPRGGGWIRSTLADRDERAERGRGRAG